MTFEKAVAFVLQHEGGYSDDPNDPGQETNFGISKRAYPGLDIKHLTREDAGGIYKRDYWDRCRCSELPNGLDLAVFDCAVNQGTATAIRILQTAVKVAADGVIGPQTIAAAQQAGVMAEFLARRMFAYATSANVQRYGLGWFRRLAAIISA